MKKSLVSQLPTLNEIKIEKAKRHLVNFTTYTYPEYEVNWHHKVLCDYLDRFVNGDIERLMVFMPPRNGKSELVSRRLPAFIFGQNPDASIIATSYGSDLAQRMNRDVQRIIDDERYYNIFPDTTLNCSNVRTIAKGNYLRNSDIFEIVNHKGVYKCAGVGGAITGMGMTYGIIDDPYKNRQDANSETIRNAIWDWYTSTFYTRLEKGGKILITLTRWHEDDLAGRLLNIAKNDPNADQWAVLKFPAVAEEENECPEDIRKPGEPLWENKYNLESLHKIKVAVGSYDWASLYQQRPSPPDGNTFKRQWFRYFTEDKDSYVLHTPEGDKHYLRSKCWRFQTADTASSQKQSADYTVLSDWVVTPDKDLLLDDVFREKVEVPEQEKIFEDMFRNKKPKYQAIETKNTGIALRQYLIRKGLPIKELKADTDKVTRAATIMVYYENGKVYHKQNAPWLSDIETELVSFPNAKHDDFVDTASYAGICLTDKTDRRIKTFDRGLLGL